MLTTSAEVLVVDDDEAIRNMVGRILQRAGFQVECARDGFEAIEKLAGHDYSVVVLDLMMPRVDGYGVIEFLRRTKVNVLRKVIVLTAGSTSRIRTEPVYEVMTKPFDIQQLVQTATECSACGAAAN